ncbi:MAG: hypothetical protein K2X27_01315 [Candidatus Obscuribacterales bacterium]|nr:hypothetical protein [Candidatus Obscuribacterales bacterium]
MKIDLHVATEGSEDLSLENSLKKLGLTPDELVDRHVTFVDNVAVSACPLIGIHMTKKYDDLDADEAMAAGKADMIKIKSELESSGQIGYAHLELTLPEYDVTIKSGAGMCLTQAWPLKRFKPCFRADNKKWDIHIAIPVDSLTSELSKIFYESGMYYIELMKIRAGVQQRFRIYTIQSISAANEGKAMFQALKKWFQDCSLPHVEMKFEIYVDMFRVGDPLIVPPTIDHVEFISASQSPALLPQALVQAVPAFALAR